MQHYTGRERATGGESDPKPEVLHVVMSAVGDYPDAFEAIRVALEKYRAKYRKRLCARCGNEMEGEMGL